MCPCKFRVVLLNKIESKRNSEPQMETKGIPFL